MGNVEAQLHGGLDLVDILPAWAAPAGKGKGEFGLIDRDLRRNADCRYDFRLVVRVVSNPLTAML
jgi:hypothetical protein